MDLKEQILVALGLKKEEQEVNLGWQSKAEDGTIFVSTLDALEVSGDIAVLTEDGSTIPVPAGEYYTPDGGFKVVEDGFIAEVLEAEAVEEETEEVVEEEVVEAAEDNDMETRLASLEKAVSELMEKLAEDKTEYKEEEVEVEEEVEASEVRGTTPKSIKTTEVVEFESLKAENEKLKAELSKKPADSPINTNKFSSEKWVATKKDLSKMSQQDRFLYNLNK
jgi:flagellar basal body rod protein FlgG